MNTSYTPYILSPETKAEARHEMLAEARPTTRPAARQARTLWQDPALYLTVSAAAVMITLLELAVRMQ